MRIPERWHSRLMERSFLTLRKPSGLWNENRARTRTGKWPSGEGWLGHNRSEKRRLWERLNPRHRKELRMLAEALALEQNHARLPEAARGRLDAALAELDRAIRRIAAILAELARRTPPAG
jgi:hypothetical protein